MRMIFRCDPALVDYLPRPIPARSTLPDWLRAMPAKARSEIHGREIRTVKQCPPFIDAMAYGVTILLPCDIAVDQGSFSWDWNIPEPQTSGHPRAPLSFHVAAQFAQAPFARGGHAALKFNSFWTIELEPGWSLFATHPVNRDDLPFRLISGLVDSDRFHDGGINFPAVWMSRIFPACCPRARRWRNASRCRAPHLNSNSRVSTRRIAKPIQKPSPRCWLRPTFIASIFARGAGRRDSRAIRRLATE